MPVRADMVTWPSLSLLLGTVERWRSDRATRATLGPDARTEASAGEDRHRTRAARRIGRTFFKVRRGWTAAETQRGGMAVACLTPRLCRNPTMNSILVALPFALGCCLPAAFAQTNSLFLASNVMTGRLWRAATDAGNGASGSCALTPAAVQYCSAPFLTDTTANDYQLSLYYPSFQAGFFCWNSCSACAGRKGNSNLILNQARHVASLKSNARCVSSHKVFHLSGLD